MNDELHPNNAGYMVMASTWYAATFDGHLPSKLTRAGATASVAVRPAGMRT